MGTPPNGSSFPPGICSECGRASRQVDYWADWKRGRCPQCQAELDKAGAVGLTEFGRLALSLVIHFRRIVEAGGGWELLWDERRGGAKSTRGKCERVVQRLFYLLIKDRCAEVGATLAPESWTGLGTVDFRILRDAVEQVLIEVKLARSTQLWHGLDQLLSYMKAESIADGLFVVVCYTNADVLRASQVFSKAMSASIRSGRNVRAILIDARRPRPASRT